MNLFHLLDGNTALVLSVLTGYFIPLLSALVTKAPTWLTGIATSLIAVLSGFLAEWAASPSHYDWKTGAATALGAWLIAAVAHAKTWAGSAIETKLHAIGPQFGPMMPAVTTALASTVDRIAAEVQKAIEGLTIKLKKPPSPPAPPAVPATPPPPPAPPTSPAAG